MNPQRRRPARLVAGVLAGALALSASPLLGVHLAGAATALPPIAEPIGAGNFCANGPSTEPFTDVSASDLSRDEIVCLVNTDPELTKGTSATTYSPNLSITRRQMAIFIKRTADLANALEMTALTALPAYDGTPDFTDIAAESAEVKEAIGQLSQADIVQGTTATTYSPRAFVTRRQMAAFVNGLEDFLTGDPFAAAAGADYFDDDNDESQASEDNLNAMAAEGIFQGDGAGNVDPGGALTRRQMANVLLRHLQVMLEDGDVKGAFAAASNQTFTVTPTNTVTQEVVGEPAAGPTREYTVTGLQAATTYTIQLFPAANVQGTSTVTFTEDGVTNTANEGAVAADITIVNGTAVASPADDDATGQPISGKITFTVDGSAVETVVPVAYRDADADGNLDLDADNTPTAAEPFGVGGATRYLPPEAAIGASSITVTAVTPERDAFVSGGVTYYVDGNDAHEYQGVPITKAQFDSMLSVGDVGTASYNPDPAGVSIFRITTDDVDAPAVPTLTVVNGDAGPTINDGRITYTRPSTNSPGVTYALQRAPVTQQLPLPCGTSGNDVNGTFATVTSATQAAGTGSGVFVFSDNNVTPDGCYTYRVQAISPVSANTANSEAPAAKVFPAPPA